MFRELSEGLGAEAGAASQVFLVNSPLDGGVAVQHFFVALVQFDEFACSGPEFSDPSRGGYELDRIDLGSDELASIDLKPTAVKEFVLANRERCWVKQQPVDHRRGVGGGVLSGAGGLGARDSGRAHRRGRPGEAWQDQPPADLPWRKR